MKKLIAYIVGISLITGGYYLYKDHEHKKNAEFDENTGLWIGTKVEATLVPTPTYEPTYIVHNLDGTIDFKIDPNYLKDINPTTTPVTVLVYSNEDKSIDFKIK